MKGTVSRRGTTIAPRLTRETGKEILVMELRERLRSTIKKELRKEKVLHGNLRGGLGAQIGKRKLITPRTKLHRTWRRKKIRDQAAYSYRGGAKVS